jgi:hypothetical protein
MTNKNSTAATDISCIDALAIINDFAQQLSLSEKFAPYASSHREVLQDRIIEESKGDRITVSVDMMLRWIAGGNDVEERAAMEKAFRNTLKPGPRLPR